eukprot:maker-scaffold1860_size26228-snap-gene-0.3 protein:Tk08706 transcript:maker-scaffold1860_size26228-snap-gene-0.3-mRNA-1 annotation:"bcs-1 protein"
MAMLQMNTLTFGDGPSPCVAIAALHKVAEDYGNGQTEVMGTIYNGFYVDDLADSTGTLAEANKKTFFALSTLVSLTVSAPDDTYRPAPYHPVPYHPAPHHSGPSYHEEPAQYQYGYAVQDDYSGVNFQAHEARDGDATNGEYRVALPDGRTQVVTYNVADAYSGFVADVRYEGYANEYQPAPYQPAPYKSAPYQPAPYKSAPYKHTFVALSSLAALTVAVPADPYRPAPYQPAPAPYHPAPHHSGPSYHEEPAQYQYGYAVQDDYAGVNFQANEARDGYATNGEYRVALPDGRTQIVTYNVADAYSGYVADVQYEGYAKEYQPASYKPAPYKPAPYKPTYQPAPYKPTPYKPTPYKPTYKPAYQPAPYEPAAYSAPYHPAPHHSGPSYHEEPAQYQYGYAVQDDYAGVNFQANEARDGYATNGEYRVALPDGRTQIVTYNVADAYSGYVADVRYEGYAEEYQPAPYKPAPYKPAPYKPAYYEPTPYKPAYQPAPYKPAPYKSGSYEPAPYKTAPYKPASYEPAPYKPAYKPTAYKSAYQPAPYLPAAYSG